MPFSLSFQVHVSERTRHGTFLRPVHAALQVITSLSVKVEITITKDVIYYVQDTYPIKLWGTVFRDFRQVKNVRVHSSAERLDLEIKGREDILQATRNELDDILYKFNGNPKEVATYYLKKHGVLVYYQNTIVGFFDIHGYSSFIERTPIEESIRKMSSFFNDIGNSAKADIFAVKVDHWILSDSIIVVVDTNRHPLFWRSLQVFLGLCSVIMADSMKGGFPLRGAIGGGDFYKDGEVMVSSALVDAALYEKEQEWLGAVLTPKAIEQIEKAKEFEIRHDGKTLIDFFSEAFTDYIRYGAIPWKKRGGTMKKRNKTYYIKPFFMDENDWASKYLPDYFSDSRKIHNSNCLYAQK